MRYKLGILGAGVMGSAILLNSDLHDASIYDPSLEKAQDFVAKGAALLASAKEVVENSDTVFFGVKPQNAAEIFETCDFSRVKYIISIMAGTKINAIVKKSKNPKIGVLRVMPNMPAMVGKGVSALCFYNIPDPARTEFTAIFDRCGSTLTIDESLFDAVTSVSGSGPAYVYLFLDALTKGGIEGGLSYESAKKLAIDTLIGAAQFAAAETVSLDTMVDRVCSKGGTTIEAVNYFREKELAAIIVEGVKRCREKSAYLSEQTK